MPWRKSPQVSDQSYPGASAGTICGSNRHRREAAFIGFVPKRKLSIGRRPFLPGRFLRSQHGSRRLFRQTAFAPQRGQSVPCLYAENASPRAGRCRSQDRWSMGAKTCGQRGRLFKALRAEYERHPFATFANEQHKPKTGRYMGQLYCSASIAKQYLRLLGIAPLIGKTTATSIATTWAGLWPPISAAERTCGCASSIVPVRRPGLHRDVRHDFCLQRLDRMLTAPMVRMQPVTGRDQGPCRANGKR